MTTVASSFPFFLSTGDDFAQKHSRYLALFCLYSISGFAELRTTVARNLASVGSNFATILPCFISKYWYVVINSGFFLDKILEVFGGQASGKLSFLRNFFFF